jgi:hypothetical protein
MASNLKVKLSREEKGRLLYDGGVRPVESRHNEWTVHSASNPEAYVVSKTEGDMWSCSCKDFSFRLMPCKHCYLVMRTIANDGGVLQVCETCEHASNHNAPYLTCSWERAFVQHDKAACDHFIPHALVSVDASVPDLVVA